LQERRIADLVIGARVIFNRKAVRLTNRLEPPREGGFDAIFLDQASLQQRVGELGQACIDFQAG
jgi:hypothetical protein